MSAISRAALRRQAWDSLKEYKGDVKRVADGGLRPTQYDLLLIEKVFNIVYGDLCKAELDVLERVDTRPSDN